MQSFLLYSTSYVQQDADVATQSIAVDTIQTFGEQTEDDIVTWSVIKNRGLVAGNKNSVPSVGKEGTRHSKFPSKHARKSAKKKSAIPSTHPSTNPSMAPSNEVRISRL